MNKSLEFVSSANINYDTFSNLQTETKQHKNKLKVYKDKTKKQ